MFHRLRSASGPERGQGYLEFAFVIVFVALVGIGILVLFGPGVSNLLSSPLDYLLAGPRAEDACPEGGRGRGLDGPPGLARGQEDGRGRAGERGRGPGGRC